MAAKKFETEAKSTFDTIINDIKGVADKRSEERKQTKTERVSPGRPRKKVTRDQTHKRTTIYIKNELIDFYTKRFEQVPDENLSKIINDLLEREKTRLEKKQAR